MIPKNTNSYARSVLNAFLPAGYPHSVTGDYLEYQIYDSLQAFSSSIAGMLSSRAVLKGIGVGDSHASPTAALLLTVLQESMGRIATILFAHRLGTSLEPECKMYRLAADIFNDSAMILDCFSPALPKASRVVLLSASSVLRSLCGVAAGSSKASLSAHFATMGNLGELNAKDSSQETIISLLGMLVGSLVVSRISSKFATWTTMIFLLAIHLGTNYLAVRAVSMRTLNRQRANLLFSNAIEGMEAFKDKRPLPIMTPDKISVQERIFEQDGVLRWKGGKVLGYCRIGVELRSILSLFSNPKKPSRSYSDSATMELKKLLELYRYDNYIMYFDEPRKACLIALKDGSTSITQLKAWAHALWTVSQTRDGENTIALLERTKGLVDEMFKGNGTVAFEEHLRDAGWDIETGALETRSGTRIKIKDNK